MAVYRRGYQRYDGPRTTHASRMFVLPRFTWERLLDQRFVVMLLVAAMFWPLLCAGYVYVVNHIDVWPELAKQIKQHLTINGDFFAVFMRVQAIFGLILAAVAGPGLIAPDLANNALPLYFSRPLSRWDYIFSRMLVLIGALSLVTVIPAILLFAMQLGMANSDWAARYWFLGPAMVLGFAIYIGIVSLVAMTSSAYVKWRVVAGALVLGFFFLLTGAAELVNEVLRVRWASTFNITWAMHAVWSALLDTELDDEMPGALECGIYLIALGAALLGLLYRKLRPVEVVK